MALLLKRRQNNYVMVFFMSKDSIHNSFFNKIFMKILSKRLLIVGLSIILFTQCSKDDDAAPADLPGVPTGEIVALEERDEVLTGDPNGIEGRVLAGPVIWWLNQENILSDCNGGEATDFTDRNEYSFGTDGILYARSPGSTNAQSGGSWSWSSSAKEAIIYQSVEFKFTELNKNAITYASRQTAGDQCAITYQRFVR